MNTQTDTGTYVLLLARSGPRPLELEVGALGTYIFDAPWYAYVGSAFGPGGFARVERHRELARGERDTRHWHIDYLLGSAQTNVESVLLFDNADRECECHLAQTLHGEPVTGFGASDCDCDSHLLALTTSEVERVRERFQTHLERMA